jgi:hypothetical protein
MPAATLLALGLTNHEISIFADRLIDQQYIDSAADREHVRDRTETKVGRLGHSTIRVICTHAGHGRGDSYQEERREHGEYWARDVSKRAGACESKARLGGCDRCRDPQYNPDS